MLKTLKTTAGYLQSLISKHTPLKLYRQQLSGIYNYLPVSDQLCTSGQPGESQLQLIKDAGFTHIINLAPHHAENALTDEARLVADLGMHYHHIPVNFQAPEEEQFQAFVSLMEALKGEKIWLHCAANMRASAFLYRYRRDISQEDAQQARQSMEMIWEPFGVWKEFIQRR